jgi:hypothetical protein
MSEDRFRQAQTIAAYKRVFLGSPFGREVLDDIASRGGLDRPVIGPDPHMTYRNAGRQELAMEIFEILNIDLRQFLSDNVTMEDI